MPRAYNKGPAEERFVARVGIGDGCWEWQGYRFIRRGHTTGYGKFGVTPTKTVQAHRYAYELWIGPIPDGMIVHHTCENYACVRPDHLTLKPNGQHQREHAVERGFVVNQYGTYPVSPPSGEGAEAPATPEDQL
jgi:hypothetical protein